MGDLCTLSVQEVFDGVFPCLGPTVEGGSVS